MSEEESPYQLTKTFSNPKNNKIGLAIFLIGAFINLIHIYKPKGPSNNPTKRNYHISFGPPGKIRWFPLGIRKEVRSNVSGREIIIKMIITFILVQTTLITLDLYVFGATGLGLILSWKLFEVACANPEDEALLAERKQRLKEQREKKEQKKEQKKEKKTERRKKKKL
ncbi:hypothetical protein POMI540_3345 [Schizosaccharomyces pombe]|uniref:Uncharacterized protein C688.12c n=1 Tax=Schizosaccharomyces pombe (strain 972 / ATCC 24843) TaxID=284812 RepID=YKQC_SCHPO|nr:uncharacterized protein SPAC688.12c [Schizosaccharomyces pombe]Q9P6L4.1 RecName: Full=Uncharacterized protein C688.12c [Schizosaccharomyces pombe 972h-]CAB90778.1 sequence orphan [Schizosaccharomyces pombe]|eukprot:NP_594070.1 uncharacterized protein SPAC688.12c [Schizosaccharomyces pombe]